MYPSDARWFIPGKQQRRNATMRKAGIGKGKGLRDGTLTVAVDIGM
jgi:hypothetical protein